MYWMQIKKREQVRDRLYTILDGNFNCQLSYRTYYILREELFNVLWDQIRDQIERSVRISIGNKP